MMEKSQNPMEQNNRRSFSGKQVFVIVVISMFVAVAATVFLVKIYLFPSAFKPVVLGIKEEKRLEEKLERFAGYGQRKSLDSEKKENQSSFDRGKAPSKDEFDKDGRLKPVPYNETGASRKIEFTERELNSLLAKNTDLAQRLAIDLTQDLVSFKLLVPVDPDFPVFGGKTLRVRGGAELAFRQGRPVVKLKGISLMGIPLPNSWLGGIKDIDLIKEYGTDEGFWKSLSTGIESIHVGETTLEIVLKQ